MASLAAACRATARLTPSRAAAARHLTSSARVLAAQNFTMPALSPTMTEGNIASWNVKEGDTFSAGDVLLEIETDKATMDVEAQDDGVMMKIMSQSGSKAVPVGTRIAVVAESGDDISALEIPADENPTQAAAPKKDESSSSSSKKDEGESKSAQPSSQKVVSGESHAVKYPLLPSVGHLVKQKGLGEEDLSKIKPTGPNGRLLKGDVLAYLGTITTSSPTAVSSRFDKLSHLDLSNIKVAEKKAAPAPVKEEAPEPFVIDELELNVPVSLSKVVEVQNRIHEQLGVFLPVSTFISRAADVANDDLPAANRAPTADELFDQVLGLDKIKAAKGSRGIYLPQISAITPSSSFAAPPAKKVDIIDILSPKARQPAAEPSIATVPGFSSGPNVFSLVVPKAEEKRAQLFLERCKAILENEPGRLVL